MSRLIQFFTNNIYLISLFFVCSSLLITEIVYTRVFSVLYHSSFLFVVLSVAMLGLGMAGTTIYMLPRYFNEEKKDTLFYIFGILFSVSIFLSLRINLWASSIPYNADGLPSIGILLINT